MIKCKFQQCYSFCVDCHRQCYDRLCTLTENLYDRFCWERIINVGAEFWKFKIF